MVAPPVPLKVSGKVKVLVGIPKLPSFAQSLLEVLELDDEVLKAELLLLDNEVLDDEVLNAELLLLDNEVFDDEELKKELLLLDDEVLKDELLLLDDELLNEELLLLDNEVLDGEALKAELLLLEDELLTLGDELLEDVFATALDANTLRADDATLVKTELLTATGLEATLDTIPEDSIELATDVGELALLDANDAVLSTEDTLLSEVAIGGVKTELPPPPPPPHAVNKHINVASMSRVIASFFNIIDCLYALSLGVLSYVCHFTIG